MAIPVISRTKWLLENLPTRYIADVIGVSTRSIDYWSTGERIPTPIHVQSLERLYERAQYSIMRVRGMIPEVASKYRGLSPDSFDSWSSRLDGILDKYTTGHVGARLSREGLTVDDLTRRQFQDMWDEEYNRLLGDIEESEDDIAELEASP